MGIRRPGAKGYEEVDGVISTTPANKNAGGGVGGLNNNTLAAPEFELASVSVVPDGELARAKGELWGKISNENSHKSLSRYFYCCTGG
jgi:hypothetical protein